MIFSQIGLAVVRFEGNPHERIRHLFNHDLIGRQRAVAIRPASEPATISGALSCVVSTWLTNIRFPRGEFD
jgi:hypothetical protein